MPPDFSTLHNVISSAFQIFLMLKSCSFPEMKWCVQYKFCPTSPPVHSLPFSLEQSSQVQRAGQTDDMTTIMRDGMDRQMNSKKKHFTNTHNRLKNTITNYS